MRHMRHMRHSALVFAIVMLFALPAAASPLCDRAISNDYGSTSTPRPKLSIEMCQSVAKVATAYGLRPSWAVAVASSESRFLPWVVSSSGAVGVMQVKPHYHCPRVFGFRICLTSRDLIVAGVAHLADLLGEYGERDALRCYNKGRRGCRTKGAGVRYAIGVERAERRVRL